MCWSLLSAPTVAQQNQWDAVENLPVGTVIRLEGDGGHRKVEAEVRSVADDVIVVDEGGRAVTIPRQIIRKIERRGATVDRRGRAKRGFWIGLGVGVLGGLSASIDLGTRALPTALAIFSASGAVIGAAAASPDYVEIYRRP